MRYRPEIDGLRALAILAILLFHADVPGFSGGFVGVDIFFVISGYLITRILMDDFDAGRFSLIQFYERRARRILPALFFMLLPVTAVSWVILMPPDSQLFGRSLATTATFWVNVLFWQRTGYFDTEAYTKPLLHCWSLSVEEQFYIFFPLLLWFLYKKTGRRPGPALLGVGLVSLAFAAVQVSTHPSLAFFFLHTRAWELLVGALAAIQGGQSVAPGRASFWAFIGLAALAAPIFLYNSQTPFPGLPALLPCLGTGLLIHIHCGGFAASPVGRWLARPIMAGVGKISYSLYLWHWPLLVLPRYVNVEPLSAPARLAAVAGAFLLAWFSWRFVENPVRGKRILQSRQVLFSSALGLIILFTVTGRVIRHDFGWPARREPLIQIYAREMHGFDFGLATPYHTPAGGGHQLKTWPLGPVGEEPRFLVWGDSHAGMWRPALRRLAEEYGVSGQAVDSEECWALREPDSTADGRHCPAVRRAVMDLVRERGITDVFIAVRYIPSVVPAVLPVEPSDFSVADQTPQRAALQWLSENLKRVTADLNQAGARVWFIENVPEYPFHVVNMLSREALAHRPPARLGYSAALYGNRMAVSRKAFEPLAGPGLRILRVEAFLCPDGVCLPGDGINTYYTDSNHLSLYGAMAFRSVLRPMFESMAP